MTDQMQEGGTMGRRIGNTCFVVLVLLLLAGCGGGDTSDRYPPLPTVPAASHPTTHSVMYRVTTGGNRRVDLTYENEGGNGEQRSNVRTPWQVSYRMQDGDFVYVSAQLQAYGIVTCEILVDGAVVETATSSGQYVIATCSGSVGR
jgi:hypothetical protein